MRQVTVPGRLFWGISGVITVVVLGTGGAHLILNAGQPSNQFSLSAVPTRTVTITQPVTSVNVQSYGAPIEVTTGTGPDVTIAEAVTYPDGDSPPAVTAQVTGGQLILAAPSCADSPCSVGFTVTLPTRVPVTAASSGGNIIISGAAGASLDSGGGAVRATNVTGSRASPARTARCSSTTRPGRTSTPAAAWCRPRGSTDSSLSPPRAVR